MARTRVVARFSDRYGADLYHVELYADFDAVVNGVKMCSTSPGLFWRNIGTFTFKDDAMKFAARTSRVADTQPVERVVIEYQDGALVARPEGGD